MAIVTTPAVVDVSNPEVAYVGTGGWEEAMAALIPNYPCCSFRGSVVALSVKTGQVLWRTYMTPNTPGYSGAGVWGATGAIDAKRKTLYMTTGNNYSVPPDVAACIAAATPGAELDCLAPDNHFDSVVALDTQTGAIKWATRTLPFDTWNVACVFPGNPCPTPTGPDYDFSQGPMLLSTRTAGKTRDIVAAGAKSGVFWALDRDTGAVIWSTNVGPGGTLGGMEWGSATDGTRIYAAVNNTRGDVWTPVGKPSTTFGAWSALDPATGQILWQTVTPDTMGPGLGSAIGAVTVANGVVYGCSFVGTWTAMNASTGDVLWSRYSGGFCGAGAAVSQGTVYWGTGYNQILFAPIQPSALTALRTP
jgi:polyvinyl alcohol dehydrogenase (cytochrome)